MQTFQKTKQGEIQNQFNTIIPRQCGWAATNQPLTQLQLAGSSLVA